MTAAANLGPNQSLIGVAGSRAKLATPAMILDLDRFARNVGTFAAQCRDAGMGFRPHAKTHKCVEVAKRQIASGAEGVCAATLHEAEALVGGGITGVLITSPIVGAANRERLADLNASADGLMAVADNAENLKQMGNAVGAHGKPLGILVDIDVGMMRTGVATPAQAIELAAIASADGRLAYRGVQGYSGRIQHITAYAERVTKYSRQIDGLEAVIDALAEAGLAPEIVSGGGTGSAAIDAQRGLFTEHQAGSYIFMDVEYNAVELTPGGDNPFATALTIQNSVISANARGFVTTNGGYKCFATDGPLPEIASGAPPGARYEYFGDEHGRIVFTEPAHRMKTGQVIEMTTPHCDPTVNLHDYYHCVQGDTLVDIWPVQGRGVL